MKYYPICTFKEFYVDAAIAKAELKNWSNWKLWNTISKVETTDEGDLSVLHFETKELPNSVSIQFISTQENKTDEFVLEASVLIQEALNLQWIITIKGKNKEQLLISTILVEGDSAALFYEQNAIYLTKVLKTINRDFIQYLNRKYLDTKWFGEDKSLYDFYLS